MNVLAVALVLGSHVACAGGEHGTTIEESEKIPVTTSSAEALTSFLQGRQLLEELRITDARRYYADAVKADPQFALAYLGLANTSTTNTEFFDALAQATANKGTTSDGERMLIEALEAAVNGEPDVQRAQLESLVAAYPDDERAYNALAIYLFGQQEYEPAIAEYRASIEIDPNFSPPYN